MKRIYVNLFILSLFFAVPLPLLSGDESVTILDDQDEDALFGSEEESTGEAITGEIAEAGTTQNIDTLLLTAPGLQWSGKLSFAFLSSWTWMAEVLDLPYIAEHFTEPSQAAFSPTLAFSLAFDARPDTDFRVLGKALITCYLDPGTEPALADVFHITELFADYNWDNTLFFRVGKHTINWGVGYFYSPADIINITPLDPENPEGEREGPLSVKINFPFALNNLYLYVIADSITQPGGIAFAPKLEWVIGNAEIGLGAIYRPDLAVKPGGMATATFKLFDFDIFAEAVGSYGSKRNFIAASATAPTGIEVVRKEETPFFDATLGFRYSYDNDEQNLHFSLSTQYFYNGDGYADPAILREYALQIAALQLLDTITIDDLFQTAQHYWALNSRLGEIAGSNLSLSCAWLGSADGSGSIAPALSWTAGNDADFSLRIPFNYGETGCEFTPRGITITPDFSVYLFEKTKINLRFPLIFQKDENNTIIWKSGQMQLGFALENGIY